MRRIPGLRSQLLVGLALILVVAALSVGGITLWAMRAQLLQRQLDSCRALGQAMATLVSGAFYSQPADRASLGRTMAAFVSLPSVQRVELFDLHAQVIATAGWTMRPTPEADEPKLAMRTGEQQVVLSDSPSPTLAVSTPVVMDGQIRGALRFTGPLGQTQQEWPAAFWLVLAATVGLLVLFVSMVLGGYVIRPLVALQQAANRVAGGDLTVHIGPEGAREFTSLAESFNSMTQSMQQQLQHAEEQRRALATSREHLIRSEKLASVGRLAAGVAHEVGNPLQAIIGFTEILLGEGLTPEETKDFLLRSRGEAQRIHRIIRQLLDYARPVEEAIEPVVLGAVVDQSVQLVGPQKRLKEVEVSRSGLAGLPPVAASSHRLVQILVNLLLNAADAMEGRGQVFIEGRADPAEHRVELRVSNTGPLIPPEHRGRIFDPFFTTKEPGYGTGLGLSVAQSIAESYGGTLVLAENEPRTTFALMLREWAAEIEKAS